MKYLITTLVCMCIAAVSYGQQRTQNAATTPLSEGRYLKNGAAINSQKQTVAKGDIANTGSTTTVKTNLYVNPAKVGVVKEAPATKRVEGK